MLDVYEGTVDSAFKWLRGPVRFKAIGEGWTSASLQATAPNRATVSYMQERGSSVTIDQDLLVAGTIIQIECDVPLQPRVFTVTVQNTCKREPFFQVDSMLSTSVAAGMTASILVSSSSNFVPSYYGGYFADYTVCATNQRTNMRGCGEYAVGIGELAAGDTLELECPISTVYAKVVNSCSLDNPVIFGTSREPDWILLRAGESFDFNVPAEDASAVFTPLGGYRTCATGSLSTATACGTETFQLTGIADQDIIQLSCPDSPPPLADMSTTIPLSIYTGYSCPNLLVQIGCEGTYCQGLGYIEGYQNVALSYPMLSPAARLRVRILRSAYSSIKWTASFGGDPTFVDQTNSRWLDIAVPGDASQINLRTSCTLEPTKINVAVINYCGSFDLIVRDFAQAPTTIPSFTGLYVQTYLDFPQLSFESSNGLTFCLYSYRTGNRQCGQSFIVNGILESDQYYVEC
jgi:hypothetical protein